MSDDPTPDLGEFDGEVASKLVQDAIAMHEILTSLVKGGWTERQAIIYLVELGVRKRG